MADISELIEQYKDQKIAIYGIGTETERFLGQYAKKISVIGLLDGFREDGEMYGFPIIPFDLAVAKSVALIIVVARPGSCKAIAKRISEKCSANNIALFDVRGRDLLASRTVAYTFDGMNGASLKEVYEKTEKADVVSFDLFDTLVTRKVLSYTDLFSLLDIRLQDDGVIIPEFAKKRLAAEKECSKDHAPRLQEIYDLVLKNSESVSISSDKLAAMEWELDHSLMTPRKAVCGVFRKLVGLGKKVVVTTDTYYSKEQIRSVLDLAQLPSIENIFVSCEENASKTQCLYERVKSLCNGDGCRILHIGDDEYSDIEYAEKNGINTCRIYSGIELFDMLGGLGLDSDSEALSDRVKLGLFISELFNDPFVFEDGDRTVSVKDASDVGYLFCAPMISDFTHWVERRLSEEKIHQILFSARDGYLVEKLYKMINDVTHTCYFLTSRTAAIRAGIENEEDIAYVDSMKYFGSDEECLRVRYGIKPDDNYQCTRNERILKRSSELRDNYQKYIDKLNIKNVNLAMFDFVAKGTTQLYLRKLFADHMKGFYFLQLEPEFMADKGLDIEPFYSDEEKNNSAIFENYYILETLLTSPDPSVEEFDSDGNPVYSHESRSKTDIECFLRAQQGIIDYFSDYINIVPLSERTENKKLDERFLALLNNIKITDPDFIALTVEDPFFGRMTAMKDVIA